MRSRNLTIMGTAPTSMHFCTGGFFSEDSKRRKPLTLSSWTVISGECKPCAKRGKSSIVGRGDVVVVEDSVEELPATFNASVPDCSVVRLRLLARPSSFFSLRNARTLASRRRRPSSPEIPFLNCDL